MSKEQLEKEKRELEEKQAEQVSEYNTKMSSHLSREVSHFFEGSILLFQDDPSFAHSIQHEFFKTLPLILITKI